MRIAIVVVWRPKNFPDWNGRSSAAALKIPRALRNDASAAPYTGAHLAGLFPRDWEITLVHECVRDVDLDMDVEAAFLSTMDFCAPHARFLAQGFRRRGVRVIVGGLYPTLNPGYFRDVADAVVVGEAEPVMPALLADLRRHSLQSVYVAGAPADLSTIPPPRYDLVETDFPLAMAYEATRGCPFTCSFCVLSSIRQPYRRRPLENVVRDISDPPKNWNVFQRKWLVFWDNNLGADRRYFREFCEAMRPLNRIWGTETSIDTVTPESARIMGRSGCRIVYIGLESLAGESLKGVNKRHNKVADFKQKIQCLHDNGVMIMSIFLIGLDGDTPDYFRRLPELIAEVGVDVPVFSFAAPIETTPFHRGLLESGRLVDGEILGGMDGMHLMYRPLDVAPEELESALFDCMRRTYSPRRVAGRIARGWKTGLWGGLANTGANLFYAPFQRTLARAGKERVKARGPWPGTWPEARESANLVTLPGTSNIASR
jgi:hypothetical protein